jgi:hypothetical protein
MAKNDVIKFEMNQSNLRFLLDKIKDLTKIDKRVILKFEKDNLILLSFVGESFKNIYAFKNYVFENGDVIDLLSEVENPVVFIAKDGKKLWNYLNNFSDYDRISCEMMFNEEFFANYLKINSEQLEVRIISGDPILIGKEINLDDINKLMNTDESLFTFKLSSIEYDKIKRMTTIDVKENDIIQIIIESNILYVGENKWKIKICDIEHENETFTFPKRYFNTITTSSHIDVYVFDTFILNKFDDYNLLIVLETSI